MNISHRPNKILVTGASGCGKTTYFLRYILGSDYSWYFIFDHQGELASRLGIPAITSLDMLPVALAHGVVLYDPAIDWPGRTMEAFAFWCEWCFAVSQKLRGKKLFCCDEIQNLITTSYIPTECCMVLETGRRHEVDAILISQAPNLIHNRVRNMITEFVTFAHVDKLPIEWLVQVGFTSEEVRGLQPLECLARNVKNGAKDRAIFSYA
jgi:hypothetical protein